MKDKIIFSTLFLVMVTFCACTDGRVSNEHMKREYNYFKNNYLIIKGMYNGQAYNLRSLDGINLYAVNETEEGIIVAGQVNDIFPGLLSSLKSKGSLVSLSETQSLSYYDQAYLRKQGSTTMCTQGQTINYNLYSFDGGKQWYQVNWEGEETKIIGNVQELYPGLLECLAGLDELIEQAQKHGPLNPAVPKNKELLEKAGFEVKKSK